MKPIFDEVKRLSSAGQPFALATVVNHNGSAPRSTGAKMLVRTDGSIVGTVGGGKVEAQVVQLAHEMIQKHSATISHYVFNGVDAASMDSICGGQVEVLVEYVNPYDVVMLDLVDALLAAVRQHQKSWLVTVFFPQQGRTDHLLVSSDGGIVGALPPLLTLERVTHCKTPGMIDLDPYQVMIEPVVVGGTVYIFGAGHVSKSLAEFTQAVGFRTVVLDDRAEYANRERFPHADEVLVLDSFEGAAQKIDIDEESFIVIVTRGHLADQTVVTQVLRSGAGYIGMIGSKRKCLLIRQELQRLGFSEAEISRLHAPIGLPIGAETPEEIGISIVAEMIQVRTGLFS